MLKGRIRSGGDLVVARLRADGPLWVEMQCVEREGQCSDSCPFFGEPVRSAPYVVNGRDARHISLQLCRTMLIFSELEDERIYKKQRDKI